MKLRDASHTLVMGILNTTPDSFSDGGLFLDTDAAIKHGLEMVAQGAQIIDVGGESTRPGAARVSLEEEQRRTLPVVSALAAEGVVVSIDTMNAKTAEAAVRAGASIINDVSGGLADPEMATVAAHLDCPYIAMHWRGHSKEMAQLAVYKDVVADVVRELEDRVTALEAAGIKRKNLILDPGIGFAKDAEHNWELLRKIDRIQGIGLPVLVGASRKRFLAEIAGEDRDEATAAISALMAAAGVWGVRVHDVRKSRQAIDVVRKMQ